MEVPLKSLEWMERIAELFKERGTAGPSARAEALGRDDKMKGPAARADRRGFVVLIDYGYTREEQLAGRHRDTLMTYQPTRAPALRRMSAGRAGHHGARELHGAARAGVERGLEVARHCVTQSQFLIGIGEQTQFADAFQECRLPQERAKVALQLKHLISPGGMGETFQVLLMARGVEEKRARV